MAAPAGMTLAESAALNRLTHLCEAIALIDPNIDTKAARELRSTVRAIRLFVQSEERAMAKEALTGITDLFVDSNDWAEAIERKVSYVRRIFKWDES